MLDLAVDHAEEIQRDVELDHEGVDHHQVAERHAPIDDAAGGAPQHHDQAGGNDQLLPGVEDRQRGLRLQRRAAQPLQALVIAARFVRFVVEVLDRLIVQQRVDGLGVRRRVELVHVPPKLRAPVGHADREDDVDDQRDDGDPGEPGVEFHREQAQHQRHFDQCREDAVQRIRDQRMHAACAALDVARHAAGLPLEVEAQAQAVQMAEHLQRDAARRALGRLREDQLAQLGEQRGRQPQQPIGEQQAEWNDEHRARIAGLERQVVDQRLQQQRHADIGQLGADHERQRQHHAPAVVPQIRQQLAQRRGVGSTGRRRRAGAGRARGRR